MLRLMNRSHKVRCNFPIEGNCKEAADLDEPAFLTILQLHRLRTVGCN